MIALEVNSCGRAPIRIHATVAPQHTTNQSVGILNSQPAANRAARRAAMLLKHYAKWIHDADAVREASKLNEAFSELAHDYPTERKIPLKYNELSAAPTGVVLDAPTS